MKVAHQGQLLMIDSGEYSDYSVECFCVVLRTFSPLEELGKFLKSDEEQRESYRFDKRKFLGYLFQSGFLMHIDYLNLYLGDYGNVNAVKFEDEEFGVGA